LLDTQWITEHLTQFGAFEMPKARYKLILHEAIMKTAKFHALPIDAAAPEVLAQVEDKMLGENGMLGEVGMLGP
jgi:leucyl/phenylalanyl-tRNA---protein transferase